MNDWPRHIANFLLGVVLVICTLGSFNPQTPNAPSCWIITLGFIAVIMAIQAVGDHIVTEIQESKAAKSTPVARGS